MAPLVGVVEAGELSAVVAAAVFVAAVEDAEVMVTLAQVLDRAVESAAKDVEHEPSLFMVRLTKQTVMPDQSVQQNSRAITRLLCFGKLLAAIAVFQISYVAVSGGCCITPTECVTVPGRIGQASHFAISLMDDRSRSVRGANSR